MDSSGSSTLNNKLYDVAVHEVAQPIQLPPITPRYVRSDHAANILQSGEQHVHDVEPLRRIPYSGLSPVQTCRTPLPAKHTVEESGPGMIFLPASSKEDWASLMNASTSGFALSGSAAMGQVGHIIGLRDVGESEDAYLFRVSLPGVRRNEREFTCQVESDGRVIISGITTTGERTVRRFSQVFEMQSRNLCPPGQFSVTFELPGPVIPEQFSGNYGPDGILEGIVMKRRE